MSCRVGIMKLAALGAVVLPMVAASVEVAAEEVTVKLWSRADRSGPLRAGNIVAAAEPLNAALKAAGSDTTVKVEVFEGPATGFDADALDILKAFSVGQGPDLYVAAHEWVGEFAKSGYAMDMEEFVTANPWAFDDVIPVLWESTKYQGKIYAIPQDSEIRMFFYNKDMLRKIGKDEAFIEGLPDARREGRVHDDRPFEPRQGGGRQGRRRDRHPAPAECRPRLSDDLRGLRRQASSTTTSGQLLLPKAEMQEGARVVRLERAQRRHAREQHRDGVGRDPGAPSRPEKAFIYHQGVWAVSEFQLGDAKGATWPTDEAGYFKKIGWIHAPAAEKGGEPKNLSHPIVYVVNPQSPNAQLAAMLVAYATPALLQHAARGAARRTPASATGRRACPPIRRPGTCRPRRRCWRARPSSPTIPISAATTASSSRRCRASRPAA